MSFIVEDGESYVLSIQDLGSVGIKIMLSEQKHTIFSPDCLHAVLVSPERARDLLKWFARVVKKERKIKKKKFEM